MAVTPKTGRSAPRAKSASTTLSASEALKAAEAAIAPAPKKAPPRKAAASSVKAIDANPAAVVAARPRAAAPAHLSIPLQKGRVRPTSSKWIV